MGGGGGVPRSPVRTDVEIPTPPFWGTKVVTDIPVSELFPFVNETVLFRGRWQFKRGKMTEEEVQQILKEKAIPAYAALKSRCLEEKVFEPKVVYGYFPCQSSGNDLIVYRDDRKTEWVRFSFPRQPSALHLCLADFFASVAKIKGQL
jgi:5-methyltetrahydrofolate--homocysteine methyltransferase